MTATITKDTLESSAYDNIISFLDDGDIVIDPRDKSNTSKRVFVHDTDPMHKSVTFSDFPYIIAEFPQLEYSRMSADGTVKHLNWMMSIIVRAAEDGADQGTSGRGKIDMLAIGDNLQSLFNSKTHRQSFADLNMWFMNLTKEDSDGITVSQKQVYQAIYSLSFETRMVVSD